MGSAGRAIGPDGKPLIRAAPNKKEAQIQKTNVKDWKNKANPQKISKPNKPWLKSSLKSISPWNNFGQPPPPSQPNLKLNAIAPPQLIPIPPSFEHQNMQFYPNETPQAWNQREMYKRHPPQQNNQPNRINYFQTPSAKSQEKVIDDFDVESSPFLQLMAQNIRETMSDKVDNELFCMEVYAKLAKLKNKKTVKRLQSEINALLGSVE